MKMVKEGKRASEIVFKYPALYQSVYKLMRFRPPRVIRTSVLYYYEPPGTGKTTMVCNALRTLYNLYPEVSYYCKLGGLSKYWDGYDNQPICWIDDPVKPHVENDEEPVQRLKTVMSTGDTLVEVKYGSMAFDSKLVIFTNNHGPEDLTLACGRDNYEAMLRRFTDTCGSHEVKSRNMTTKHLPVHLITVIL